MFFNVAFCGGHVFAPSMFHSVLVQAYYEKNLIPLLKMFLFDGRSKDSARADADYNNSTFFQSALPADGRFLNIPFATLFEHLLTSYRCLVMGLFRESSESGKQFEYVVLNPSTDILIRESDMIFAFGNSKPDWVKY
jgi:hypothetical protein